jgi:hypothetical protein
MLAELRDKPPNFEARCTPRWLAEYNAYHRHATGERARFESLAAQTSHELQSLTKLAEGGAQRVVVDQQFALCAKLLGRIERYIHDNPSLKVTDPLVVGAVEKRANHRQKAATEIASEHNIKQIAFNELVAQAARDIDLVRDMSGCSTMDPRWAKQLGTRMRTTAEALLCILSEADDALTTTMPPSVTQWLARTANLIEQEKSNG